MKKKPNEADLYAGKKVRERRLMINMSQEGLADIIGLTFQQVQKYEKGANRMGASRLAQIAEALHVPISYFFISSADAIAEDKDIKDVQAFTTSRQGLAIIKSFQKLTPIVRDGFVHAIEAAAHGG